MRFSRTIAAAGVAGVTLLSGAALTGTALADTPHPHRTAVTRHDDKTKGHPHPHKTSSATPTVAATLDPSTIRPGGSYTVSITTTNVADGTDATVSGPDGKSSTVAVESGTASTTLSVTRHTRPGRHTVSISVDGVSTSATLTVTR